MIIVIMDCPIENVITPCVVDLQDANVVVLDTEILSIGSLHDAEIPKMRECREPVDLSHNDGWDDRNVEPERVVVGTIQSRSHQGVHS